MHVKHSITVIIIDDHQLLVSLLHKQIEQFAFVKNVISYTNPSQFLADIETLHYDVLLLDISMPEVSGHTIIEACRKSKALKDIKILILSSIIDVVVIKTAISEGANGYLSKNENIATIEEALKTVTSPGNNNPKYFSAIVKQKLLDMYFDADITLTKREREILYKVCDGKTVKEIAFENKVTASAIQFNMKNIFRKFEVNRTPDLILKAIKLGYYIPYSN